MTNIFRYGLPLSFGLLLLLSWTDALFLGAGTQVQSFENKTAVKAPDFRLDLLDPFPRDAEAYFNDQFPWKGFFQRFNAKLQALTNKRSPLPDLVVVGEDDWLYKGGLQLDIYRGKRRFTPKELKQVVNELQARRDSIRARGGEYYLAIAPLKHHIYPEFLPDHVRPLNQQYAVKQLYVALDQTELPYIDLHSPLRSFAQQNLPLHLRARQKNYSAQNDLYFRTDHHWTVRAGLISAQTITNRFINDGFPLLPLDTTTYRISVKPAKGKTLAQIIGTDRPNQDFAQTLHHNWTTKDIPRTDIPIPDRFPYKKNYVRQRMKTDAKQRVALPSLFVNRESFGENLVHPLSEQFSSTFLLFDEWKHNLNLADYDREGGDIYLQLIWEGFLFNLLEIPQDDGKW